MHDDQNGFARAFGDALRDFLDDHGISVTQAAERLGTNKQTLSTYWTDNADGNRPSARAELLFLACTRLGFIFEYEGSTIAANPKKSHRVANRSKEQQLQLPFDREFLLADERGTVSFTLKRPAGEIQLNVRLKAAS